MQYTCGPWVTQTNFINNKSSRNNAPIDYKLSLTSQKSPYAIPVQKATIVVRVTVDAQNADLAQPDTLQPMTHGLEATSQNARTATDQGRPILKALQFLSSIHIL
jgi:hypothetical protein